VSLALYNTLTRRQEPFAPLDPANVRMYVCGPTVYDRAHIGNARPVVVFDVLYRLLRALYGEGHVTYARNITDVDDKIMAAAKARGIAIDRLTAETTALFHDDMAELGTLAPDLEPRATNHIPQMIRMIEELIASDHAYAADGHVLFHVPSMPTYGRLSRRSLKEMIAGARVEVAPYKKDPADFVLWKPSAPDQPGWESPWSRGRPGWHIECSAMSEAHLGETFDIHGGGLDLIFPHHENEIAQSVCAHHGKEFVRVWLHNGFLSVNGEKMSKSLGNFFTVRELLDKAPGEAIRLCLLSAHYRAPLDWTDEALNQARQGLDRLYGALRPLGPGPAAETVPLAVQAALEDDLNTPKAIAELHEIAGRLNKASGAERDGLAADLRAGGALLGLLQADPEAWFKWRPESGEGLTDAAIDGLIARRIEAKKARNFPEADRIRDELKAKGVALEDTPQGTKWRRA
jgi:cysteinyl-tRNA synthetase